MSALDGWLTTTEAVQLSGYHIEYIRYLGRKGKVRMIKLGHIWLIDREDFEAYLAEVAGLGTRKYRGIRRGEEGGEEK